VSAAPPPPEYALLTAKVDSFAAGVQSRCGSAMSCRTGCAGCCLVELSVSNVEAAAMMDYLRSLHPEEQRRVSMQVLRPRFGTQPRCVLLDDDDACRVYSARPLVCRTQGLPLRYPQDLVPAEAVRVRLTNGVVTVCPLNFTTQTPPATDVLDAERVDQILAVLNHRHSQQHGLDPARRWSLTEIVMAACETPGASDYSF